MPGVEIVTAAVTLLRGTFVTTNGGDGRLKHVEADYPRLSEEIGVGDLPRCVVYESGHDEEVQMGGGRVVGVIGQKMIRWALVVHLFTELDAPLAEGPAWRQLLDDVEALLRLHGNDGFNTTSTGATSRILQAHRIKRDTLPPDRHQLRNAYNSYLTVAVEEWISA